MDEIRLNKLIRRYNVGLQELVAFLRSLGIQVDSNPNARVSDNLIPELDRHFRKDITLKKVIEMKVSELLEIPHATQVGTNSLLDNEKRLKTSNNTVLFSEPKSDNKPILGESQSVGLRVLGKIDISDHKKANTSRKRERIQQSKSRIHSVKQSFHNNTYHSQEKILRTIWTEHLRLQQQQLEGKKKPIKVIPSSARLIGNSLQLSLDLRSLYDCFVDYVKSKYQDQEIEVKKHKDFTIMSINSSSNDTMVLDSSTLAKADASNVYISPNPAIWGTISSDSVGFEDIKSHIQEDFPSIQFYRLKGDKLLFFQEYQDDLQSSQLFRGLQSELDCCHQQGYGVYLQKLIDGKNQYVFFVDKDSEEDDIIDSLSVLRGLGFTSGNTPIGKLYRLKLPRLFFDCSDVDKEEIQAMIDSKSIMSVVPDLAGEEEVLFRLNHVMDKLSDGSGIPNPHLGEILFSVEKAMPTTNLTSVYDDYYREIQHNLLNKRINKSQIDAIIKTLLAQDISIIQGPPGTGKSTAIAEMIWQHIKINGAKKILVTSETNIAVDNALSKVLNSENNIVKPIRIGNTDTMESEGSQFAISSMKKWVEGEAVTLHTDDEDEDDNTISSDDVVLQNWLDNISRRCSKRSELPVELQSKWESFLSAPNKELREMVYNAYVSSCNVIGATCSSIGEKNRKGRPTAFFKQYLDAFPNDKHIYFDIVIQDESSKATPAELALPLLYGGKSILIGDHRQLPPMIDRDEFISSMDVLESETPSVSIKENIQAMRQYIESHFDEMEKSHFERLFLGADTSIKGTFNTQYRMHPDINDVIRQFYINDGGLECGLDSTEVNDPEMSNPSSRYHGIFIDGVIEPDTHVLWVDTTTPEIKTGTSRVNYGEIEVIDRILELLSQTPSFAEYLSKMGSVLEQQIGLISFYGKQVTLLKELSHKYQEIPTRVCSVDRFQGMERNIIIVSLVRSNIIAQTKEQKPDMNCFGPSGYPLQTSLGFAQSPNRLNVALSRAKRLLIIVGNSRHFRQKQIYDNLFLTIQNNPHCKIIKPNELG